MVTANTFYFSEIDKRSSIVSIFAYVSMSFKISNNVKYWHFLVSSNPFRVRGNVSH